MSQKLFAIMLVIALTGSAMAGHAFVNTGYIADEHQLVQQHTVFVSLIEESQGPPDRVENITEIGAVVGLVKECQTTRTTGPFDNAVLWLNDQFLFGNKTHLDEEPQDMDTEKMGENPEREHDSVEGEEGFVEANRDDEDRLWERHADCWIPRGFIHGVQSSGNDEATVRQVIDQDLDGSGSGDAGSHCDYDSSFYVTDPNGHQWVIDRMDCTGITGFMYTGHLQVDPGNPDRQGFADRAEWAYSDGTVRAGAPYPHPDDDTWDECKAGNIGTGPEPDKCSLEYSFLLAISLDEHGGSRTIDHCTQDRSSDGNWAHQGESHPHNPEDDEHDCGPGHEHEAYSFDLVFHDRAPHWIEERPYWDNAHSSTMTHGTPPSVTFAADDPNFYDCEPQTIDADEPYQEDAIHERSFTHPCDDTADRAFHLHDGSQTPRKK